MTFKRRNNAKIKTNFHLFLCGSPYTPQVRVKVPELAGIQTLHFSLQFHSPLITRLSCSWNKNACDVKESVNY